MIDVISTDELRRLATHVGEQSVSIYLPTHRAGKETAQDPIRLENLASRAIDELVALGARRTEAEARLGRVLHAFRDGDFHTHLEDGLAAFVDGDQVSMYRLPDRVEELVVVADRFHLKPLLPSVASGEVFYVLALSQKQVRLLRGTRYRIAELELVDAPESLTEALWYLDRERQLQYHGAQRVGRGRVAAIFHGHGMGKETHDADIVQFFRAVDEGVRTIIGDHRAPLVLAGVAYLHPLYRTASRYPAIVDGGIEGNPEPMSAEELHDRAWPLVEPVFNAGRDAARAAFLEAGAKTVSTVADAVDAAHAGRMASLFVPRGVTRWGIVDETGHVREEHEERRPGDRDLLDDAAVATLTRRGEVYVVDPADVPGDGPVAGVLRY